MIKVKLAELLARRKELIGRVANTKVIDGNLFFQQIDERIGVGDNFQEKVLGKVKKLPAAKVTEQHDWHQNQLETVDRAIQSTNWSHTVTCPKQLFVGFGQTPQEGEGQVVLGSLLLRRKHLDEKVKQTASMVEAIKKTAQYNRPVLKRANVGGQGDGANLDNVTGTAPTLDPEEVQKMANFYSQTLRRVDNIVQQANWSVEVSVDPIVNKEFEPSK